MHIDEAGHRLGNKRGWAWVFANKTATLIKLTGSRGAKILEKTLPRYEGKVVSDRYSCYSYFLEGVLKIDKIDAAQGARSAAEE